MHFDENKNTSSDCIGHLPSYINRDTANGHFKIKSIKLQQKKEIRF